VISITRPIGDAIERTKWILFQPFDLGKWFILGFCAFLAGLGEGGGGSGSNFNPGGGDFRVSQAVDFVQEHLAILLLVSALILMVLVAVGALFTWLNSRGKFMFLHGVVNNVAEVSDPWHRFRDHGNSLFVFRFVLQLLFGIASLGVIAFALFLALPDMQADQFGSGALAGILFAVGFFLVFGIAFAVLMTVIKDFVVPVMYLRNVPARDALGIFRRELLAGHLGSFILFYLMKIVLGLTAGIIILLGVCFTCCIAALPYLSSVFFLPITVFFQCYNLHFLEQFGPQWRIFPRAEPQDEALPDYTGAY
jgi:hypothetical protein